MLAERLAPHFAHLGIDADESMAAAASPLLIVASGGLARPGDPLGGAGSGRRLY